MQKTVDDVVPNYISNFSYREHIVSLLMGNVQSGKTSHMFGLISAAADEGFNIFLLLTSDNTRLQEQTFIRALNDLDTFCVCNETDYIRFQTNALRKPVLIVLKKNVNILKTWKKNIVDVLIEISSDSDIENVAQIIENNGFIRMLTEEKRISFNSGYTKAGFADKVFHIHLRYIGDNDELYFRDYLREHPQIAKEYETLKLNLWKQFEHNRDAYTEAKTGFIRKWTDSAKEEYAGRY